MLYEYEVIDGVSIMDGTDVSEALLLEYIGRFVDFAMANPNSNLVEFFNARGKAKVPAKVTKALALLGLKHCVSEYNTLIEVAEKAKAEADKDYEAAKEEKTTEEKADVREDSEAKDTELSKS